jgi:hypothetical protein
VAESQACVTSAGSTAEFAHDAEAAFRRAAGRSGQLRMYCRLAGSTVCFEVAGRELLATTRALAHLETGPALPDLVVRVFDRMPLPRPPWDWTQLRSRGEVPTADPAWCVSYLDEVLSLWHRDAPAALVWIRDVRGLTVSQRGSPFLHLLHAWVRTRGSGGSCSTRQRSAAC